jgi:hypothetical protein
MLGMQQVPSLDYPTELMPCTGKPSVNSLPWPKAFQPTSQFILNYGEHAVSVIVFRASPRDYGLFYAVSSHIYFKKKGGGKFSFNKQKALIREQLSQPGSSLAWIHLQMLQPRHPCLAWLSPFFSAL